MVPVTLPLVSYSSGRKVTRQLREEPAFATTIEDLWRPFFCISASLRGVREVVHERGPVWRAVRSSISIPGIFPPVHDGDDLLVDGGVMNNLPVDVMAGKVALRRSTCSPMSNPLRSTRSRSPCRAGACSARGSTRARRGPGSPACPTCCCAACRWRAPALIASASSAGRWLHLCPPTGTSGLLDFRAGPALIEPAYRHTLDASNAPRSPPRSDQHDPGPDR